MLATYALQSSACMHAYIQEQDLPCHAIAMHMHLTSIAIRMYTGLLFYPFSIATGKLSPL